MIYKAETEAWSTLSGKSPMTISISTKGLTVWCAQLLCSPWHSEWMIKYANNHFEEINICIIYYFVIECQLVHLNLYGQKHLTKFSQYSSREIKGTYHGSGYVAFGYQGTNYELQCCEISNVWIDRNIQKIFSSFYWILPQINCNECIFHSFINGFVLGKYLKTASTFRLLCVSNME